MLRVRLTKIMRGDIKKHNGSTLQPYIEHRAEFLGFFLSDIISEKLNRICHKFMSTMTEKQDLPEVELVTEIFRQKTIRLMIRNNRSTRVHFWTLRVWHLSVNPTKFL